ncbi:MAG: GPP34 family phosphoprotein [Clostridiaceae bacterium]|nr:GPP34 family phosphoprotein [Clostridiaceae bacterium]
MRLMDTFMFAAINKEKGSMLSTFQYLLFGASAIAALELIDKGKLSFDGKFVSLTSTSSEADPILDEICSLLKRKKSPCRLRTLISYAPYQVKRFNTRLMEKLEDDGLIRIEQRRFLGLFPYSRYLISRINQHDKLIKELKEVVLKNNRQVEREKAFLVALLYELHIFRRYFSNEELNALKETFKQIKKYSYFEKLDDTAIILQKYVKEIILAIESVA